jgi:hypothetical protein
VYSGFVSYPPWNVPPRRGHHEPLISANTYDRIQERLKERQKMPRGKDTQRDFPLRGFVLCAGCRKPYTACWAKGRSALYPYYVCQSRGCPCRYKSVRAERMHEEFEEMLGKLKPRENIMQIARIELMDQWQARRQSVEAVRQERQAKLDAIDQEIAARLDAIKLCQNATVIQAMEEKVSELEARRLRLGGPIEKPTRGDYDYQTAVDAVFDFLKDPLRMWKKGELGVQRLVLRLVFAEPLVYDRKTAFQTATFSPPIALSCVPELDKMEVVDMVRTISNRLEEKIREWYELLCRLPVAEKVVMRQPSR